MSVEQTGPRTYDLDAFRQLEGQELGHSGWQRVTQEQINLFADATGDHQWIHVDPEKAKQGPFRTTIAHGYLTLSLLPALLAEILHVEGVRMGINYGLDRVRFPAPVRVDSRVRASARCKKIEAVSGGVQATLEVTVEIEGSAKPACIAEPLYRYYA